MRVLGIDFGTSNTVAMLRTADGRTRPLLFDGSPLLPSAVYLNSDGKILIGRDAERNARVDPARFEPNPKRRIDDGEVLIADQAVPVPRLFGYVLSQVNTEARRQLGAAPDEVRLTHPARWGERRRSLLLEAARHAGLGKPQLIAEPVGAASYFTSVLGSAVPVGRSLAIYDLGGGTFDATVVRRTQTGFEVLAEDGLADVGGLDFDHAIVEHLGRSYAQSNTAAWATITSPTDSGDRRLRRLLYEDVRGAKEMLSRTSSTDIHLPALEIDAHLTREELESLVRPYLERTVECLKRTIAQAKLAPSDLVGIFLVGGSSRIPLAAHLIHTEVGVAPTTLEQPETVVVEGALCIGSPSAPASPASGIPRTTAPMRGPQPQQQQPQRTPPPQGAMPVSGVPVSPSPISGAGVSPSPMSGPPAPQRPGPFPPAMQPRQGSGVPQRPPVQQPMARPGVPPRPPVQQQPAARPQVQQPARPVPLPMTRPPMPQSAPPLQQPGRPMPQPGRPAQQRPPIQQQMPPQQMPPQQAPGQRPPVQQAVQRPPVQQAVQRPVSGPGQPAWQQPAPAAAPRSDSDRKWIGVIIGVLVLLVIAFIVLAALLS